MRASGGEFIASAGERSLEDPRHDTDVWFAFPSDHPGLREHARARDRAEKASWVLAAQVPRLPRIKAKQTIKPRTEALLAAIDGYRARSRAAGRTIERVVAIYEAGWSGSGWPAGWYGMVWRRPSSSPPVFRLTAGRGVQNPMGSTPNCSCVRCWPGLGASRACARWYRSPTKPMRMSAGASENGRTWWLSGSVWSIVLAPCWRPWGA